MSTKNNPGAYDCYGNAEPDEPLFVLLARDKHAPALIWLWATLRELDDEDPEKVAEARQCADHMMRWQMDHGRQGVGFGTTALASLMELIRAANLAVEEAPNAKTSIEFCRRVAASTKFPEGS